MCVEGGGGSRCWGIVVNPSLGLLRPPGKQTGSHEN